MAKKKVSRLDTTQTQTQTQMSRMDEKFQSLKSLNAMLLKETFERRQQVDSLQSQLTDHSTLLDLQTDLVSLCVSEQMTQLMELIDKERDEMKANLRAQLEETKGLEMKLVDIRKDILKLNVQNEEKERKIEAMTRDNNSIDNALAESKRAVDRMKKQIDKVNTETEFEIGVLKKKLGDAVVEVNKEREFSTRVSGERDGMKAELQSQVEETKGLSLTLFETDNKLVEIQKQVLKLNMDQKDLLEENDEKERKIESMTRDKNSIDKCLAESNQAVDRMKKEIEKIVKDKEAIEEERNVELRNRNELEKKIISLNEFVMNMQNEEKKLRENIAVLEKRFVESVELQKQKVMEINTLVQEKREGENNFKRLIDDFDEATQQLDEHKKMLKEMSQKKYEIEEAKQRGESEISELQKQLANLRDNVLSLEECGEGHIEKIQQLESEISHSSDEFHRVTNERDEARKGLEEGKLEATNLRATILEMEKKIESTGMLMGVMKDEQHNLIGEKKNLESQYAVLKKDISLMEIELAKTRKDHDHIKAKGELENANFELVLNLLKNTTKWINASKEEMGAIVEEKGGEEIEPFVVELNAIKKGFYSRDTKVEEMKGEVKLLEDSLAEAHKKKSFWTLVSSATTVFAAAAVAYVARGY